MQRDHEVSIVQLLGSKAQGKSPGQVPHLNEGWQLTQALRPLLLQQFCVQLCPRDMVFGRGTNKAALEKHNTPFSSEIPKGLQCHLLFYSFSPQDTALIPDILQQTEPLLF